MTPRDLLVAQTTFVRMKAHVEQLSFGQKALLVAAYKGTLEFEKLPIGVKQMLADVGYSSEEIE